MDQQSYHLQNKQGMHVQLSNYGARITSIKLPINGELQEMLVTYPDKNEFLSDPFYLGATCGRVCNRIAFATFELKGKRHILSNNHQGHCLHGGADNFSMRFWQSQQINDCSVEMRLVSEHGDQGFPGQLETSVLYELDENNTLKITYNANSDQDTPINLTNHAYFNLGDADCKELELRVYADHYLPVCRKANQQNIPTGEAINVAGTRYDFRRRTGVIAHCEQGYDDSLVLTVNSSNVPQAELFSPSSGIMMRLYTNQPTVQLYTGQFLSAPLTPFQGLCIEAQGYIDAVNQPHFPDAILKADETYQKYIHFQFSVVD